MIETLVYCVQSLWDKFLSFFTDFYYGFLSDDQLAEIQAKAEEEIIDSTIKQNQIYRELRSLLWQRYEEDGYEEEEIKLLVEEEIKDIKEGR